MFFFGTLGMSLASVLVGVKNRALGYIGLLATLGLGVYSIVDGVKNVKPDDLRQKD